MRGKHTRKEDLLSRLGGCSNLRTKLVAGSAGLIGATMLSGGVFAAWAPSASISSGTLGAANLAVAAVDANGTTFSTGVNNLLPGDYLNRYVDLTNNGSVAQTFTGNVTDSGALSPALTIKIDTCSVAWSANGSCSGTSNAVLAATATSPTASIAFPSLAVSAVSHARFQFALVSSAVQATYQNTTATEAVAINGTSLSGGADRTAG